MRSRRTRPSCSSSRWQTCSSRRRKSPQTSCCNSRRGHRRQAKAPGQVGVQGGGPRGEGETDQRLFGGARGSAQFEASGRAQGGHGGVCVEESRREPQQGARPPVPDGGVQEGGDGKEARPDSGSLAKGLRALQGAAHIRRTGQSAPESHDRNSRPSTAKKFQKQIENLTNEKDG